MMSQNTTPQVADLGQQNTQQPPQAPPSAFLMLNLEQQGSLPSPQEEPPAPPNMGMEILANSPNQLQNLHVTLQQLMQIVRGPRTSQAIDQVQQILRNNPPLLAEIEKRKRMKLQQQQQQAGPLDHQGLPASLNMDVQVLPIPGNSSNQLPDHSQSLDQLMEMLQVSDSPQQQRQHVQQQQPQTQQQQQQGSLLSPQGGPSVPSYVTMVTPPNLANRPNQLPNRRETLQQLMQIVRGPRTPQTMDQIRQVLRNNPSVMAEVEARWQRKLQQKQQQSVPFCLPGPPAPSNTVVQELPMSGNSSGQMPDHLLSLDQLVDMLHLSDSPRQQQPQAPEQLQQGNLSTPSPQMPPAPPIIGVQMLPTPDNSSNSMASRRENLQRLLQILRLPSSPQQHEQILQMLRSNPSLMAAFIKQRQQQRQRQHVEQRRHL